MSDATIQARIGTRALAVPAAALLGAMILVSVIVRVWFNRSVPTLQVIPDEVFYANTAEAISSLDWFWIPNQPPNLLYPFLIAPAWLLGSMEGTFEVAKTINVVLMSIAAVPVYLWGRRLMPGAYALIAAGLTLLLPAFALTMTLMSENAVFPAFVLAAFAVAWSLELPTRRRQVVALAAIGLACAARLQLVVLVPVLVTAIVVKVALDARAEGEWRLLERLRSYALTAALLAATAVVYVVGTVALGEPLRAGLGGYGGTAQGAYEVREVAHWAVLHLAELVFAAGFLPAAAFVLLFARALRRRAPSPPAERALLAVGSSAVIWVAVELGAVVSGGFTGGFLQERYTFFVLPILFLAFAVWLAQALPRPPEPTTLGLLIPAVLLFAFPIERVAVFTLPANVLTMIPLVRLVELAPGGFNDVHLLMGAAVLVAGCLFVFVPRRLGTVVLPAAVAAFLLLASYPLITRMRGIARELEYYAVGPNPSWIDGAVDGADVGFLTVPLPNEKDMLRIALETEFWNRSIGRHRPIAFESDCVSPCATVDAMTGRINLKPGASAYRYMLTHRDVPVVGDAVASSPPSVVSPLVLYRVEQPLRLASRVEGLYPDGWMSADAMFTQYAGAPGPLELVLSRTGWPGPSPPGRVTVDVRPLRGGAGTRTMGVVRSGRETTIRFSPPQPPFQVHIHIEPTFSPAAYGGGDARQLGAQVGFRRS